MTIVHQVAPYAPPMLDSLQDDLITRAGVMRPLRGRLVVALPERRDDMDSEGRSRVPREVEIQPGICVTWRCNNPVVDGLECEEHASEPLPKSTRDRSAYNETVRLRLANDPEWAEKERTRRREASRRARQDPAYRERHNARKRAQRAAAHGGAS